jgi:hypothetical protein
MSVHLKLVNSLRDSVLKDSNDLGKHIVGVSDEQACHKVFHSYRSRGDNPKGLRLTWLGLQLLATYFRSYEVKVPEDYRLGTLDLLYLDNRAQMPYYIGYGETDEGTVKLVVFEAKLAIVLKLADGMVSNLRDMES